jgi:DNA-directed RNA polymerase subunit RPC12/RpoP
MSEQQNQINVYRCPDCGWRIVTRNRDEGVTPMFIRCEGSKCDAGEFPKATSAMYRVDQSLPPTHEWFKPTKAEVEARWPTADGRRSVWGHVQQGGLILQPLVKPSVPFTGNCRAQAPCIACPVEVRGLYAVAFNLLNLRSDPDRWNRKIGERLEELQMAVTALTPFIEAHFGDKS